MNHVIGWWDNLDRRIFLRSMQGVAGPFAGWFITWLVAGSALGFSALGAPQTQSMPLLVSQVRLLDSQVDSIGNHELESRNEEASDQAVSLDFFQQASDESIRAWLQERVAMDGPALTADQAEALTDWVDQATQRLSVEEAAAVYFDAGRLIFKVKPGEQALEFFLRSAQLTDAGNTLANIQRWVGDVHSITGAFEPAVEAYLAGLQVAEGGDAVEVELLLSLGDVSRRLGETDRSLRYLEQAKSIAQDRGLIEPLMRVLLVQASVHRAMDANEQALAIYEQGLESALSLEDPVLHAMFYNNIGNVLRDMGQYEESLAFFNDALFISEAEGSMYGVGINHINQALVHYLRGEYEQSLAKYELALPILNELDRPYEKRALYEGFAYTYQALGQYEQAIEALMRFNELNSEILNKEIKVASEEIQTRYETLLKDSQLALNAAEIREKEQVLQTAAVVIVALLIIVGALIGFMRYRNQKFQVLYQRNKELMLASSYAKRVRQEKQLAGASLPNPGVLDESSMMLVDEAEPSANERMQALFERVVTLFEEEKIFTQPDVTITDLAKSLASNRTYVSQAISYGANMSFPSFLNFYRVNEARRLLHEDEKAWSAQSLATEVGYGSVSSLYRAFDRYVGMSPVRYAEAIRAEREGARF